MISGGIHKTHPSDRPNWFGGSSATRESSHWYIQKACFGGRLLLASDRTNRLRQPSWSIWWCQQNWYTEMVTPAWRVVFDRQVIVTIADNNERDIWLLIWFLDICFHRAVFSTTIINMRVAHSIMAWTARCRSEQSPENVQTQNCSRLYASPTEQHILCERDTEAVQNMESLSVQRSENGKIFSDSYKVSSMQSPLNNPSHARLSSQQLCGRNTSTASTSSVDSTCERNAKFEHNPLFAESSDHNDSNYARVELSRYFCALNEVQNVRMAVGTTQISTLCVNRQSGFDLQDAVFCGVLWLQQFTMICFPRECSLLYLECVPMQW